MQIDLIPGTLLSTASQPSIIGLPEINGELNANGENKWRLALYIADFGDSISNLGLGSIMGDPGFGFSG